MAPAALGLLAPVAANATELNINGVSDYAASSASNSREQVTSITQFSDVYPTDWAYQALSNLIERYGCVAGYPNGTYRGNRAMTRFEAAALLNACLDRVTEVTDELKRLMKEFEKELAILKGRVDGLEARVGELEATQFSTTTKLSGLATFVVGANDFYGTKSKADPANRDFGATTFNYDLQLSLETSFTGKDLLLTVLRSGNFASNFAFGGNPNGLSTLETAFQEDSGANSLGIDKLFYQFPVGNSLTFTFGARVGQEDMLAVWPSAYPSDPILDVTTLNGAPAAYNKNLGVGAGVSWSTENGFSVSANYVAAQGSSSDPMLVVWEPHFLRLQEPFKLLMNLKAGTSLQFGQASKVHLN
ncbi:outer membrane porin [Synechococcus sp. ROS8604]|nr:outer membrane porin [Synechococcus sp. ROS8604]